MKKIIFLTALSFFAFQTKSIAQITNEDYRTKISIGFKAGINIANVFDTEASEFRADSRIGLAAGGFLHIPIGAFLGIQPEVMFSQKGFKGQGSVLGTDYEFNRTSNFIDVPLLLALKPIGAVTIFAGPQYSYLLSTNDSFTAAGLNLENIQEFENQDLRNNILGAVLGLDVNLNQIVLGVRASWDLMNNSADGNSVAPRYRNAVYQFTAGFRF
ncbi:MAG: porin family protein [Luteibaculaceae bacterium]